MTPPIDLRELLEDRPTFGPEDRSFDYVVHFDMYRNFGLSRRELRDRLTRPPRTDGRRDVTEEFLAKLSGDERTRLAELLDRLHEGRVDGLVVERDERSALWFRAATGDLAVTIACPTPGQVQGGLAPSEFRVNGILRRKSALDVDQLRKNVVATYTRVAQSPGGEFSFHRGPRYAADFLGYDFDELTFLPQQATAAFAGVGNPLAIAALRPGETVLDIGCGAGMDLILAARRVRLGGRAIGVDPTPAMCEAARAAAYEAALRDAIEVLEGDAESLPLPDRSVDVAISNGVFNLTPNKSKAYGEVARVLKPGGRLAFADIVIDEPLSDRHRDDIELWTR